jgi:hypothetical protein
MSPLGAEAPLEHPYGPKFLWPEMSSSIAIKQLNCSGEPVTAR